MDESVLASLMTEVQELKGMVTNQTQLIESLSPAKEELPVEEPTEEPAEETTEETPEEEPTPEPESKPDVDIEELDDLLQRD